MDNKDLKNFDHTGYTVDYRKHFIPNMEIYKKYNNNAHD